MFVGSCLCLSYLKARFLRSQNESRSGLAKAGNAAGDQGDLEMAQLLQLHFIHMDASWGRWRLNTQHRHEHMAAELASWLPVRPSHAAYREELLSFAVELLQDATIALQAVPHAERSELAGLAAELASARGRLQAAINHQRSCSASHSSPLSAPACAASVLPHAPHREGYPDR